MTPQRSRRGGEPGETGGFAGAQSDASAGAKARSAHPVPARRGRPPSFEPTAAQRQLVTVLIGAGVPRDTIATMLRCTERTLRKHFRHELAHGMAEVVARISAKAVQKALSGDNSMMQYYLSRFGGAAWRDRAKIEHTGPNDGPLAAVTITTTDPAEAARTYQRLITGG